MTTLADVRQDLGRVEGKIDTFIQQLAVQDERTAKLTDRVTKVENRQHWYSGIAAALGALLGMGGEHAIKG